MCCLQAAHGPLVKMQPCKSSGYAAPIPDIRQHYAPATCKSYLGVDKREPVVTRLSSVCWLQFCSSEVEERIRQKHPGFLKEGACQWRLSDFSDVVRVLDTTEDTHDVSLLGKGNAQVT